MAVWLVALTVGAVAAIAHYARLRAPALPGRAGLAALRAIAIALAVALLLDAQLGRSRPVPATVYVDGSLSMTRGDSSLARAATDSARAIGADSVWAFGDSVRAVGGTASDADTRIRGVVERSLATGT